ncbi:MAG TPA: hypothetical protein PKE66_11360 [Pyrinomonadaceae bacterium]|nr:hypothetical protein [Pyrinomonadaceae bacterium]
MNTAQSNDASRPRKDEPSTVGPLLGQLFPHAPVVTGIRPSGSVNLYGELRTYAYRLKVCGLRMVALAVSGSTEVKRPWVAL